MIDAGFKKKECRLRTGYLNNFIIVFEQDQDQVKIEMDDLIGGLHMQIKYLIRITVSYGMWDRWCIVRHVS